MKTWVIKLGGAAITNPESVKVLARAMALLKSTGQRVVIVHGAGPVINQRLVEKGISWSFHEGQRITTPEMMSVIEGALGEVNQMICDALCDQGLKPAPMPANQYGMFHCEEMDAKLGQVGKVIRVNGHEVKEILKNAAIPVIAPIGLGPEGMSFNINADAAAAALAVELQVDNLIFATDQRGILDLNELPYDSLTLAQLRVLMEKGGVTGGMLAKSRSIEAALINGVRKVCITHAMELSDLIETRQGGTLCVAMSRLDYVMKLKEAHYAVS